MKPGRYSSDICESKTSIIMFVRFPHAGKVKTRLAQSLGEDKAAALYRLCVENLFTQCLKLSRTVECYVFYADGADRENVEKWASPNFILRRQEHGMLGNRIANALGVTIREGAEKAIIMASDVPDLSVGELEAAIDALDSYDLVIGPSLDGGYYLLGLKKLEKTLFKGIDWSTENVFRQTLHKAKLASLRVFCLPQLLDIDTKDDLRLWLETTFNKEHEVFKYAMAHWPNL
jgi:rSAM/selenodomain-associated transferase 1